MILIGLVIFMELEKLQAQKESEISGFFWLGLQIAFIFGIPAAVAVFIGKKLSAIWAGNSWVTICLVISFIFSWIIIIIIYRKKSKKINTIEARIREIKKESLSAQVEK